MPDDFDWSVTTFEGNRMQQHRAFQALSFREKIEAIEKMGEVIELFQRNKTPQPSPRSIVNAPPSPQAPGFDAGR